MAITADSFGADLPENWEEIAQEMNEIIRARGIEDENEFWDEYWSGKENENDVHNRNF